MVSFASKTTIILKLRQSDMQRRFLMATWLHTTDLPVLAIFRILVVLKCPKVEMMLYLLGQQFLHKILFTFIKFISFDNVECDDGGHDFGEAGYFPLICLSEANKFVSLLVVEAPAR